MTEPGDVEALAKEIMDNFHGLDPGEEDYWATHATLVGQINRFLYPCDKCLAELEGGIARRIKAYEAKRGTEMIKVSEVLGMLRSLAMLSDGLKKARRNYYDRTRKI